MRHALRVRYSSRPMVVDEFRGCAFIYDLGLYLKLMTS